MYEINIVFYCKFILIFVGSYLKLPTAEDTEGTITNVQEFPQQLMATVLTNNNEYFVPLIENFITDIDIRNKIIKMTLPQGIFK